MILTQKLYILPVQNSQIGGSIMFKSKKALVSLFLAVIMIAATIFMVITASASQSVSTQTNTQYSYNGPTPKYVFLFIGDGMSYPQINSAEIYLGKKYYGNNKNDIRMLGFSKFPVAGTCTTYDAESFVPDSASAGSSISSGIKTINAVINMDPSKKIKYKPISEMLKEKGYKIGIVSSVSIDHATPACFYAKQPSRNNYYEIAMELANSNFDFFGGGGFKLPKGKNNDQPDVIETAKKNGFTYVNTKQEILALNSESGRVIAVNPALDKDKALPYDIDRSKDDLSLADFTRKAIDVLYNSKGFFLMVEGGKIDWACHANDAGASIHDTLAFDKAVNEAVEFYNAHPKETLIIVTGDHECGGMTIGFAGTAYETFFDKIGFQTKSYLEFDKIVADYKTKKNSSNAALEDLLPAIKTSFGLISSKDPDAASNPGMVLTDYEIQRLRDALKQTMIDPKERKYNDAEKIMYGGYEPLTVTLTHILNNKAGIGWTSYSHTGLPLPVFAKGLGQELFDGYYDNTDIFKKLCTIMKVSR